MTDSTPHDRRSEADSDALADLIRVAGHRRSPPAQHYQSVRDTAHAAWRAKLRQRRRRRAFALAASLAALIGVAVLVAELVPPEPTPVGTLARAVGDVETWSDERDAWMPVAASAVPFFSGDRIRASVSGGAALTLAEGGMLRIDAATEMRLLSARSFVLVAGTLYVDSGESAQGEPIEIATPFGRIRDVGTQFEVRSAERTLRVRVRSGRVLLADSTLEADLEAAAGAELELAGDGSFERRSIEPDASGWDWAIALATPPDAASVLGLLEWIARETGKPLRFAEQRTELRVELIRWRGNARGLTPLELLEAIVATADLSYELTADGAILIGQR